MNTKTKPFDYAAFIDSLRDLLAKPRFSGGIAEPVHSQNHGFVQWKQRLIFLIEQIERQGYQVPIKVKTRSFDMPGFIPNQSTLSTDVFGRQNRWFQHACIETDAEINTVIDYFDRHGAPDVDALRASQNCINSPERMSTVAAPKPFDYAAFIHELSILRDSFVNAPANHRTHNSQEFKLWRHQIIDLIDRIQAKGYDINCRISGRQFRVMSYASISPREQQAAFDRAHAETMIELNTIISNFEKYGDPKATHQAAPALSPSPDHAPRQPLEWNKEATLMWYLKNTPATTLWSFGACVCALVTGAFLLGIMIEKRWPDAKPLVAADSALKILPPQYQSPAASQPVSVGPVQQHSTGEKLTNQQIVPTSLNEQPGIGQGTGNLQSGEQLSLSSGASAPQPAFTASR